jgi:copper transport protein
VPVVDGGVADLQEAVAIRPNQPGHNVILVDVFDTRRPSPGPVRTVTVTLLGLDGTRSTPLHGQLMTDGRWSVPVDLNAPGRIRVQVDAGRPGLPVVTQTFAWTVGGAPAATRTATISTAPLRSTLQAAAIAAGLICLAAWAIALSGRRRARRRPGKSTAIEEVAASMESQIGVGARDG